MKILLLGKNGQVGWELQRSLQPLGEVVALDRHSAPCATASRATPRVRWKRRATPSAATPTTTPLPGCTASRYSPTACTAAPTRGAMAWLTSGWLKRWVERVV